MEVEKAIGQMKSRRAGGPTELVGEIIHTADQVGVKKMTEICNIVVDEEKIPRDWELSSLLPIYKGKGDPLEYGAHRAMKVFERNVNTNGMQFGFMPGKGMTCRRSFWKKGDHCITHWRIWRGHLIGYQKKWLGGH